MFTTLILIVHLLVCVILVLMILLQSGKGADIGAVFGGGSSNTVFGSTGAATFLSKVTIGAAVTFMCTSIILTYFSGKSVSVEKSIMTEQQAQPSQAPTGSEPTAPAKETPVTGGPEASAPQPAVPVATDPAKAAPSVPVEQPAQAPKAPESTPTERYTEPAAQAPKAPDAAPTAPSGDTAAPK
jgi:preprotein translocase subunit SecG